MPVTKETSTSVEGLLVTIFLRVEDLKVLYFSSISPPKTINEVPECCKLIRDVGDGHQHRSTTTQ